jgi:hypothetical protein
VDGPGVTWSDPTNELAVARPGSRASAKPIAEMDLQTVNAFISPPGDNVTATRARA